MKAAFANRPRMRERTWWLWIILPAVALLMFMDGPAQRIIDRLDPSEWLVAYLDVDILPDGSPRVWYRIDASRDINGVWKAYPESRDGQRWPGGSGPGQYATNRVLNSAWTWEAFFGRSVPVPDREFRVCVFYNLTSDAGVERRTDRFCSDWVTP